MEYYKAVLRYSSPRNITFRGEDELFRITAAEYYDDFLLDNGEENEDVLIELAQDWLVDNVDVAVSIEPVEGA